jgi:hypothetical protein
MGSMPARPAWISRINDICSELESLPRPLRRPGNSLEWPRIRCSHRTRRVRGFGGSISIGA